MPLSSTDRNREGRSSFGERPPAASLVFTAGPNAGRRYRIGAGECIIGRRSDCQVFVPDMRVSRQHARIRSEQGGFQIEDLGSNNGTYVNGQRISHSVKLGDDDEITIANNTIRVELPASTPSPASIDTHVTIVDLANPRIYVSTDEFDKARLLQATSERSGEVHREIRLLDRKLHALMAILELAASSGDPHELLEALVGQLLDVFPRANSVGILVEDERTGELKVQCQRQRRRAFSNFRVPGTIIQHVVKDHRGILLRESAGHAADVPPSPGGPPSAAAGAERAPAPPPSHGEEPVGSRMGAPIQAQDSHYGVVYVESASAQFRQEDVDLLTSVAAQAGLAIHTARMRQKLAQRQRLERDLRVARQIQRSLLPRAHPNVSGLEFAVHYEPAYQIGGDFYDFIWHDKDHLSIVVGDVAGKAISAALYMARLTSELRSRAAIARTPSRLLTRVNEEMLSLGDDGMFATLVYATYDLSSRTLVFTNAGHMVPLLRREGRVFPLHSERAHVPPVGVMGGLDIGEARVQLLSGDLLVFTTDGIHEARDAAGNEYGIKRLSRRIRSARGAPEDVVKAILQDVDDHVASENQGDDITIVAMHIGARRPRRRTDTMPGHGGEGPKLVEG